MIRLRRLLLDQIGDHAARFPHVVIDCTDPKNGEPLDSIVWLKNGGGKTSLLALLFSLLNPRGQDFLGYTPDQRSLGDYVQAGDTSYVAAEWQTSAGLVVTGAIYEWPDRRRPVDARGHLADLHRRWFVFKPQPGMLTFDDLPLRDEQQRRLAFEGAGARLRALAKQHRALDMAIASTGTDWHRALQAHEIDPIPFRYQKQMNHTEGSIDERFRFAAAGDFVNFLLELAADEDAVSTISQNARQVADKLARRPLLEAEERFCRGAADLLDPVASAWHGREAARDVLDRAIANAASAQASFRSAAEVAERAERYWHQREEESAEAYREAERRRKDADALATEYRHIACQMHVDEASAAVKDLERKEHAVSCETAAWEALEHVLTAEKLEAQIEDIDRQLRIRYQDADGLRSERDAAAFALRMRLLALAQAAREAADDAEQAAKDAEEAASACRTTANELREKAQRAEQERDAAIAKLTDLERAITAQRAAGRIGEDETPTDAHIRWMQDDEHAAQEQERIEHAIRDANDLLAQLRRDLPTITAAHAKAAVDATKFGEQYVAATTALETLEQHPRLRELAQADRVAVYAAHSNLDRLLTQSIDQCDRDILDANVGAFEDQRHAKSLQDQRLLAAPRDVEAALAELERGGIRAVSGFAYVAASVARDDWDALIAAAPAMVAGIAVDDAQLDDAREHLEGSGIRTTTLVAVSPKSSFHQHAGPVTSWVVPTEPALYDEDQAEDAEAAINERLGDLEERLTELRDQRDRDRTLRDQLTSFLNQYPDGTIQRIERSRNDAASARSAHQARIDSINQQHETLEMELRDHQTRTKALSEERLRHAHAMATLEPLVNDETNRNEWEACRRDRDAEAAELRTGATRAESAETQARDTEKAQLERNREEKERAERLTREADEISVIGDEPAFEFSSSESGVETDVFRSRFELLDERYRERVSDPELTNSRRRLLEEHSNAKSSLSLLPDDVVGRIGELRGLPQALEGSSRQMAMRDARNRHLTITGDLAVARQELEATRKTLDEARPPTSATRVRLTAKQRPIDRADAEKRWRAAQRSQEDLRSAVTRHENARLAARSKAEASARRRDTLSELAVAIDGAMPTGDDAAVPGRPAVSHGMTADDVEAHVDAFEGSEDEAKALRHELVKALKEADAGTRRASQALDDAVNTLKGFATSRAFGDLDASREVIVTGDVETLAADADRLAGEYRTRAAVLSKDLASLEIDREILVGHLAGEVRLALELLKRANRVSKLPRGLGSWEDQPFLKIEFDDPRGNEVELKRLVGTELDEFVERGNVPEGRTLLQRAVHAAVPKGFRIRVLKPNAELHLTRVSIAEMGKWSGGEKLTAAVLLYCTLARLRTSSRAGREFPAAGVLVLDNPLGKSSYVRFLTLQRHMARALGVQLLYTTAVKDLGAVGTFPNVIRCRNVPPRNRSGRAVIVDDRVGDAHGRGLVTQDTIPGQVSAVHVARHDLPLADDDDDESAAAVRGTW